MRKVEFFIKGHVQTTEDTFSLRDQINDYLASLPEDSWTEVTHEFEQGDGEYMNILTMVEVEPSATRCVDCRNVLTPQNTPES